MSARNLERSVARWQACSPKAMAQMSPAAIEYALADARHDILLLAGVLCAIAYPRRGTPEEGRTLQEFAEQIQAIIPHRDAVELKT